MQPVQKATIATQLFSGIGLGAAAVLGLFFLLGLFGWLTGRADSWGIGDGKLLTFFPLAVYLIIITWLLFFNAENKTKRQAYQAYLTELKIQNFPTQPGSQY